MICWAGDSALVKSCLRGIFVLWLQKSLGWVQKLIPPTSKGFIDSKPDVECMYYVSEFVRVQGKSRRAGGGQAFSCDSPPMCFAPVHL